MFALYYYLTYLSIFYSVIKQQNAAECSDLHLSFPDRFPSGLALFMTSYWIKIFFLILSMRRVWMDMFCKS